MTTKADAVPAKDAHLIARKIQMIEESKNWKDKMAGWHKHRVTYTFDDGTVREEVMSGRSDDCLYSEPEVEYCHCGASRPVGNEDRTRPLQDGHVKVWH